MIKILFCLYYILFQCNVINVICENPSNEEHGFLGTQFCSDCNLIHEYVKNEEIYKECKNSCVMDKTEEANTKYSKAILEICKYNLRSYPHIENFINNLDSKIFPNLKVRMRLGAAPKLYLVSNDKKDSISITKWKTEEIHEYLKDHLI